MSAVFTDMEIERINKMADDRATLRTRVTELEAQLAQATEQITDNDADFAVVADGLRKELATVTGERDRLRDALTVTATLIAAMETCHDCGAEILVDSGPTHCEDCSYDCDAHEEPDCVPLYDLHLNAKLAIKQVPND